MSDISAFEKLLASNGISLQELGLRDVALKRNDALRAVEMLKESSVPILGGDVYFIRDECIEQAFANWHVDRLPSEDLQLFIVRSCSEAAKYIEVFPDRSEAVSVFVLVVPVEQL